MHFLKLGFRKMGYVFGKEFKGRGGCGCVGLWMMVK